MNLIESIDAEIATLERAKAVLLSTPDNAKLLPETMKRAPGRPKKDAIAAKSVKKGKRNLTAEARKQMADAQKARWERVKRGKG